MDLRTILITGGAGYFGSRAMLKLREQDEPIVRQASAAH
jgi:nucleoside-diphosphate-sugar epimerase